MTASSHGIGRFAWYEETSDERPDCCVALTYSGMVVVEMVTDVGILMEWIRVHSSEPMYGESPF